MKTGIAICALLLTLAGYSTARAAQPQEEGQTEVSTLGSQASAVESGAVASYQDEGSDEALAPEGRNPEAGSTASASTAETTNGCKSDGVRLGSWLGCFLGPIGVIIAYVFSWD